MIRKCWRKLTPLLIQEGRTRYEENAAKPPLMERTGWSLERHFVVSNHPVCAVKVASQHLTGAATPPL